jgi:S1-C subfamily serine protease
VRPDGVVLTSASVVGNMPSVDVTLDDGSHAVGTNLGTDPGTRLAVVDLPGDKLSSARMVAPDAVAVGDTVVLAGMGPDGDLETTMGTLEAQNPRRKANGESFGDRPGRMLQVTADEAPASGMQGAAVVDASGAVLGLTTWSDDDRFYVAPIDEAGKVAEGLLTVGDTSP